MLVLAFSLSVSNADEIVIKSIITKDLKPVSAAVDSVHHTLAKTRNGGIIDGLSVEEGSHVEQGQTIAIVIDPKQPLEIDSIDAQLRALEHERDLAIIKKNRFIELKKNNAISQSNLDETTTRLKVLENNIQATNANRKSAIERKSEGKIFAPLAGRIIKVPVTNGSVVMPGDIVSEIAVDGFILRLSIPERHAQFIKQGDEIKIQNGGSLEDGMIYGAIHKLYPLIESGQIMADVAVDNLQDFYVGQRMTAFIPTSNRKAFFIPQKYIIKRHGLNYVKLKNSAEIVIQTGLSTDAGVEILSGIRENDILVTP